MQFADEIQPLKYEVALKLRKNCDENRRDLSSKAIFISFRKKLIILRN